MWESGGMDTPLTIMKYKNHRFPVQIVSHAVGLSLRFCLSFREVEELWLEHGLYSTWVETERGTPWSVSRRS